MLKAIVIVLALGALAYGGYVAYRIRRFSKAMDRW